MKRNKILCKSLKTVETLGAVSVICSDKTGTLTKNQMTVTNCFVDSEEMSANAAAGVVELNSKESGRMSPLVNSFKELARAGALCNGAEFDAATNTLPVDQRRVLGDATDSAILRFVETLRSVSFTRQQWKQVFRIPFNSKDKYMVHVAERVDRDGEGGKSRDVVLYIKGAPDILMPRCSHSLNFEGGSQPLSAQHRKFIEDVKDNWSREAKRVILIARKKLSETTIALDPQTREFENAIDQEIKWGLELVGMVGMVDPPRDEIPEAIQTLRGAGIRVHMVTGDFTLTSQAIAAQCGIITQPSNMVDDVGALSRGSSRYTSTEGIAEVDGSSFITNSMSNRSIVVSGSDLATLDEAQWDKLCSYEEIVFARTTPEHKLRIVKELQARGETVGMTGDGVNDAPSLKAADIGIAMGSGSDVSLDLMRCGKLRQTKLIIHQDRRGSCRHGPPRLLRCYR
jgi:sodium/potassium-transporting ATPase subunit alpha